MPTSAHISTGVLRYFFIELVGDILYFPIWWYSAGFIQFLNSLINRLKDTERHLAIRLLAQNLFLPMFGQDDRQGRIISFFMRLVLLFGRVIYFCGFIIISLVLMIFWLALPIIIIIRLLSFLIP